MSRPAGPPLPDDEDAAASGWTSRARGSRPRSTRPSTRSTCTTARAGKSRSPTRWDALGRPSSRHSSSRSDDAGPLPRNGAHVDRSRRARALPAVAPASESPHRHGARREPAGRAAFCTGRTRAAGALLILAGLFDFLDGSLARASGQVYGVRRVSRLGHRPLLRPGRAARDRRAVRADAPRARGDRRDGGADRLDDGELHEGARRVDRRALHRGDDGASRAHDLSHRRRPPRPAGAGAVGPGRPREHHGDPAHRLHLARDARRRAPAGAAPGGGAPGPIARRRLRDASHGPRARDTLRPCRAHTAFGHGRAHDTPGPRRAGGARRSCRDRAGLGRGRGGLPGRGRRAAGPRVRDRRGSRLCDRRPCPLPARRCAGPRRRSRGGAGGRSERGREVPHKSPGAARPAADRGAGPARRPGRAGATRPGPTGRPLSGCAGAAGRPLPARPVRRGARAARDGCADLSRDPDPGAGEWLRRRRGRPARRAADAGRAHAGPHAGAARRPGGAAASGRRPRDGDERGGAPARRGQDRADRGASAPRDRRQPAKAPPPRAGGPHARTARRPVARRAAPHATARASTAARPCRRAGAGPHHARRRRFVGV